MSINLEASSYLCSLIVGQSVKVEQSRRGGGAQAIQEDG